MFPNHNLSPNPFNVVITGDNYSRQATIITDLVEGESIEMTVASLSDDNGTEVQKFISNEISDQIVFSFNITKADIYVIIVRKTDGWVLVESVYYIAFSYSKEYDSFFDRESAAENLANIAEHGNGAVIISPEEVFIFNAPDSDDSND